MKIIQNTYSPSLEFTGKKIGQVWLRKNLLRPYLDQGLSISEIAKIFNTTECMVENSIRAANLTSEELQKIKENEEIIIAIKQKRGGINEMIESTGLSANAVKKTLGYLFPLKNSTENNMNITEMVKNGADIEEIEAQLNIPNKVIKKVTTYRNRDEKIKKRDALCIEALRLKKEGYSVEQIAAKMNRCVDTIWGYLRYCEQKHIDIKV